MWVPLQIVYQMQLIKYIYKTHRVKKQTKWRKVEELVEIVFTARALFHSRRRDSCNSVMASAATASVAIIDTRQRRGRVDVSLPRGRAHSAPRSVRFGFPVVYNNSKTRQNDDAFLSFGFTYRVVADVEQWKWWPAGYTITFLYAATCCFAAGDVRVLLLLLAGGRARAHALDDRGDIYLTADV